MQQIQPPDCRQRDQGRGSRWIHRRRSVGNPFFIEELLHPARRKKGFKRWVVFGAIPLGWGNPTFSDASTELGVSLVNPEMLTRLTQLGHDLAMVRDEQTLPLLHLTNGLVEVAFKLFDSDRAHDRILLRRGQ